MRKWLIAVLISATSVNLYADSKPIKKLAILALAKDTALSTAVESGLKDNFAKHGINAAGLHTIFISTLPVTEMVTQLRAQGFDSLLCLSPRRTIHWSTPTSTRTDSGMQGCLSTYVMGTYPSGDPLEISPLAEDHEMSTSAAAQTTLNDPIPSNPGATPYRLNKGLIRLYDVSTSEVLWQGSVAVKMPEDLRTELQVKLIVHEIWLELIKADLVPKS